jgi:hypothetical protein
VNVRGKRGKNSLKVAMRDVEVRVTAMRRRSLQPDQSLQRNTFTLKVKGQLTAKKTGAHSA